MKRLQISVNMLQVACDCRTRLVLRLAGMQDAGQPPPGGYRSMVCGKWGHVALATWLSTGDVHQALAAISPYAEISKSLGIAEDRRGYQNLGKILAEVMGRYQPLSRLPFTPQATEVSFVALLGEVKVRNTTFPVDLIGYIDAIVIDKATGKRTLLEHKFTGKLDGEFARRFSEYDPQTTAYMLATECVTGERIDTAWVNAIETAKVPDSDRKCNAHGVLYNECGVLHVKQTFVAVRRTPQQLEEFRAQALDIAKRIIVPAALVYEKKGVQAALTAPRDGIFTNACHFCDYSRWCLTGQRGPTLMASMLTTRERDDARDLKSGFVTQDD